MDKIASFQVDHSRLKPGIYISRKDKVHNDIVTTIDIRVKAPNVEPAMSPEEAHTIEHLGATYLRNLPAWKDRIIYFGPMGCLTGFYLIVAEDCKVATPEYMKLCGVVMEMFRFVASFEGEIPGAKPDECGNWRLHDLPAAKKLAAEMVEKGKAGLLEVEYPAK